MTLHMPSGVQKHGIWPFVLWGAARIPEHARQDRLGTAAARLQHSLRPIRQPKLSLAAVLGKDSEQLQALQHDSLTGLWK